MDVERKLEAVDSRLQAAADRERDLDARQAALLEKVGRWGKGGCVAGWVALRFDGVQMRGSAECG